MKKTLIFTLVFLLFVSCKKEEVITCYSDEEKDITEVVDIVDATKSGEIATATALEPFYSDGEYTYLFSSIKSQHITVYYSNGESENIVDALDSGRIDISELDRFNINYIKECYVPTYNDNVDLPEEQNTVTTLIYKPFGIEEGFEVSFSGSDSVEITELLNSLKYDSETCDCLPEYTFETELGTYGVNLSEGYARTEGKQATLSDQEITKIAQIIDTNNPAST